MYIFEYKATAYLRSFSYLNAVMLVRSHCASKRSCDCSNLWRFSVVFLGPRTSAVFIPKLHFTLHAVAFHIKIWYCARDHMFKLFLLLNTDYTLPYSERTFTRIINEHCLGISIPPPLTDIHKIYYIFSLVFRIVFSSQQMCFNNCNHVNNLIHGSLPGLNTLCKRTCNLCRGRLSVSQISIWLPSLFAETYVYIQKGSVSWGRYVPGVARLHQVAHYQNNRLRPFISLPPL